MTNAYTRIMEFPNGLSYRELALYASDETALAACKRRFSKAEPGERMTLLRESGEFVFKLERPLALSAVTTDCYYSSTGKAFADAEGRCTCQPAT